MKKKLLTYLALSLLILVLANCTDTKSEKVDKAEDGVQDAKEKLNEAQEKYEREGAS